MNSNLAAHPGQGSGARAAEHSGPCDTGGERGGERGGEARARLRRRREIAREAARLVRTRGLAAARLIGRLQLREAEFALFERFAERCEHRLRGAR